MVSKKHNVFMQQKRVRAVKVYGKFRGVSKRWLGESKEVPWLNVSGLWLESAGFRIGDQLQIDVENNKLIITNQPHGNQSH